MITNNTTIANETSWWDDRNPFKDQDYIYWGVHMGLFFILVIVHMATLFRHRHNWLGKRLPGQRTRASINPELKIHPASESDHEISSTGFQLKKCLRFKLTMIERPMILDIVNWIGMLVIIICIRVRANVLISGASIVALFDLMQFVYMVKLYHYESTLFRIQLAYTVIAGFPIGTVGKLVLALSLDRRLILLHEVLGVYQYVFEVIAGIFAFMAFFAIYWCLCKNDDSNNDGFGACTFFILSMIIASIFACAGVAMAVISYLYLKQQNMTTNDFKTMLNINVSSAMFKACPCWTWSFLAIWIPMLIASMVFLAVSSKGFGFYFIPDYITLLGLYASTVILAYHLDTFDGTTMTFITNGYVFFPLILCFMLVVIYHLVDVCDIMRRMNGLEGQYKLYRTTGQIREDIARMFKNTWDPQAAGVGQDTGGLKYSQYVISDIARLHNPVLFDQYKAGKEMLKEKYKDNPPLKIEEQRKNKVLPVHTSIVGCTQLDSTRDNENNEYFLFHGTDSPSKVDGICKKGFLMNKASKHALFGKAIYLAERSVKSDQYCDRTSYQNLHMFVVRTCLGRSFLNDDFVQYSDLPCTKKGCMVENCKEHSEKFDTIVSDLGTRMRFREFLIFDKTHCYPEFLVVFNRIADV